MDPQILFFLAAFVLIAVITFPILSKAKYGLIKPLDGEKTLFEEEDITTALQFKNGHFIFTLTLARLTRSFQPKSVVKITNKRIIVAQKLLLKKGKENAVIRQIINFSDEPKPAQVVDFLGGYIAKGGYMTFEYNKLSDGTELIQKGKKDVVVMSIPTQKRNFVIGLGDMTMHFYTKRKEEFMKALS